MRPRPAVAAVAALTALAAALRFSTLAVQSFWVDEAVTHRLVAGSFGDMLAAIPHSESTPPLFYVLAWPWTRLFGSGEVGLRSLSALAGTLAVPVVAVLAHRLGGARAAVAAAALTATSPLLIWYGQEARSYALLVLLSALSLLLALRAADAPARSRGRALAAWALCAVLALATHYFALFVVVPEALWLLARSGAGRRQVAVAVAAVGAAGVALLPLAIEQTAGDGASFIRGSDLGRRLAQVPKQLLVGYHAPHQAVLTVLAVLLGLAAVALLARAEGAARRRALVVAALGGVAVGVPVVLALAGADYLITRNLLAAWPALAAAGAVGLARGRAGALVTAGMCAVGLTAFVGVETDRAYQREDWRGAARALRAGPAPRVIVLSSPSAIGLGPYLPTRPLPAGATVRELDVLVAADRRAGLGGAAPEPVILPPPPGFAPARIERSPTYVLVRYRAARPTALAQTTVAAYARTVSAAIALRSP